MPSNQSEIEIMPDRVIYQQVNKDHAYWTEKRRAGQFVGGHTSGLLTHFRDNDVVTNILFDAGLGTINGLNDLAEFSWRWPLTVFVTHGHPDHHLELMILSELWCKREVENKRGPLKVYCTGEGEDAGTLRFLWPVHNYGFTGGKTLLHVPVEASKPLTVGIFTIHAIDVDHFPGAVIYVVEFGENRKHKLIIGWDMKTLPNPDEHRILKHPSLALLEANTWTPLSSRTGHTSVAELVGSGFIEKLEASQDQEQHYGIYLVHFGGGEDPNGVLSDMQLEDKLRRELDSSIQVARRGQLWNFLA